MDNLKNKDQMNFTANNQTENSAEAKYIRAKERVTEIKDFYSKLLRSALTIVFLAAINYYTNGWFYMWFLWAALGIGISLAYKATKVFGMNPFLSKDWEERKIREFMDNEEQQNKWK